MISIIRYTDNTIYSLQRNVGAYSWRSFASLLVVNNIFHSFSLSLVTLFWQPNRPFFEIVTIHLNIPKGICHSLCFSTSCGLKPRLLYSRQLFFVLCFLGGKWTASCDAIYRVPKVFRLPSKVSDSGLLILSSCRRNSKYRWQNPHW